MLLNLKNLFLLLIICSCQLIHAQDNSKKKDTSKVYRSIEKYSKKRKFTKFIHKLIFEPVAKQKIKKNTFQKIKRNTYSLFEGKIIRKIQITTLDPFGYSDEDSTQIPSKFVFKSGNALHLKTKNLAIRNLLLLKRNTPLDSLLVKESERLIRSQRFVRSVTIQNSLVSTDSVDISIRVLDSWSLVPNFALSDTKASFYLTDKNFLGIGHEFSNSYFNSLTSNQNSFNTRYVIPNIANTFVRTTLSYEIDFDGNYSKFISVERPFFSPYSRWAAGITLDQQLNKTISIDSNQVEQTQNYKYNSQDYWAGRSFKIFKGNSEFDRSTNFITTARFFSKNYIEKPTVAKDSLAIFSSEKLYLVSLGISSRKFTQDKYVFNFNITEDVASGFVYNVTSGFQNKNNQYRYYLGGKVALGSYFEFGYLSTNLEYGTFFNGSTTEQSALIFSATYFTNLFETGTWKFRQFVKPQVIIGNNRLTSTSDRLTLNGNTGIPGFSSEVLLGTKKLLVTLQTQGYSPWRVIGFRLNPFLSCTMGLIGQDNLGFNRAKLYSQIGMGVIISNDYLVFSSFQFSFSIYPSIPDGKATLKTNSFRTGDFSLQGFDIYKPTLINYQ